MTFPTPLLDGEKILREEKAIYIRNNPLGLGYNLIYGTLWLTSQRLVHQSFLGALIQYPLSHVTNVMEEPVFVAQRTVSMPMHSGGTSNSRALRVDFDTTGREYFIPHDISGWVEALLVAKENTPSLAYTRTPPTKSALEHGNRNFKIFVGIFAAVVLCFLCSVGGVMLFIFLVAVSH